MRRIDSSDSPRKEKLDFDTSVLVTYFRELWKATASKSLDSLKLALGEEDMCIRLLLREKGDRAGNGEQ